MACINPKNNERMTNLGALNISNQPKHFHQHEIDKVKWDVCIEKSFKGYKKPRHPKNQMVHFEHWAKHRSKKRFGVCVVKNKPHGFNKQVPKAFMYIFWQFINYTHNAIKAQIVY